MATSSNAEIARLLNLNPADSDAFYEVVNDYFGPRNNEEDELFSDDEESDQESDDQCELGLDHATTDLAEEVIPLHQLADSQSAPKPSQPVSTELPQDISRSCICKANPCYLKFSAHVIDMCRMQYSQLTREEKDIAILAKIESGIHLDEETRRSKQGKQSKRACHRTDYFHRGIKICRKFFQYLHCVGEDVVTALLKHYNSNGVEPRIHGNSKKLPKNALEYKDTRAVVDFIVNYSEIHAIQLPGRTPKHWVSDVKLLPSDCTKSSVYLHYKAAMEPSSVNTSGDGQDIRIVSLRTFQRLWKTLVPFVCTMPPASDLCWTCQKATYQLRSAANREEEKAKILCEMQEHLRIVKRERAHYQEVCLAVKQQIPTDRPLGCYPACSFEGMHHVSLDFAQQVHYPSDPQQPGPVFFKTPRKCGLFRVNSEGCGVQLNYLIDEAHSTGKGANVVISLLHDYLENHSLDETHLHLHADNCAGQNKNNQMLWYLMWRCVTKRNRVIQLSFLVAGYTKFSPDGGLGLIKRKFRRTKVDCLQDILDVVNSSSKMNVGKLVGTENGSTQVPTYDWTRYLSKYFVRIKGIKASHHFTFDGSGKITTKPNTEAEGEVVNLLLKDRPDQHTMPDVIQPSGLSAQRKAYLFKEIRPFVAEDKRDIVTPQPDVPIPDSSDEESGEEAAVPAKRPKPTKGPGVKNRGRGRGRGRGQVGTGTPEQQ